MICRCRISDNTISLKIVITKLNTRPELIVPMRPGRALVIYQLSAHWFPRQRSSPPGLARYRFSKSGIRVTAKSHLAFKPKNKEKREVPVLASLLEMLKTHRAKQKSNAFGLVFPTTSGQPDEKHENKLKRIAWRAGLDCGSCVSKHGNQCMDGPYCSHWFLHISSVTRLRRGILQDHVCEMRTLRYQRLQRVCQRRSDFPGLSSLWLDGCSPRQFSERSASWLQKELVPIHARGYLLVPIRATARRIEFK